MKVHVIQLAMLSIRCEVGVCLVTLFREQKQETSENLILNHAYTHQVEGQENVLLTR